MPRMPQAKAGTGKKRSKLTRSVTLPVTMTGITKTGATGTVSLGVKRKQKSQAQKIRDIISNLSEKKNFHTLSSNAIYFPAFQAGTGKNFGCFGAATTSNQTEAGAVITYGGAVTNLLMLKPFKTTDANDWQRQQALDGLYATPTMGKTSWTFQRYNLEAATNADDSAAGAAPMYIRVIRVTPKGEAGTTLEHDPDQDLFKDQWGQKKGVVSASFKALDIPHAQVNLDRYTVLNDIKFQLNPPVVTGRVSYQGTTNNYEYQTQVAALPGNSMKTVTFHHQLTAKKGGAVRYASPNDGATENATTGMRREYVFVHTYLPGVVDSDATKAAALQITCRAQSQFTDK